MRTNTAKSADIATGTLATTMADLPGRAGWKLGPTRWHVMTQEAVTQFANLTGDHNFIHVDPERARDTPFRGTIAHGFFTLAMLGPISQQLLVVEDAATSINYGLNKVRFPAPLRVDAEFRGHGEILDVIEIDGGFQVTASFTIEVRNGAKPVLVAECLLRYYR